MSRSKTWASVAEVADANRRAGHHFFDPDTIKFFSSRIETDIVGERLFIPSEQDETGFGKLGKAWDGERRFTIRIAEDNGQVHTIGQSGFFREAQQAYAAAEDLYAGEYEIPDGIRAGDFDLSQLDY